MESKALLASIIIIGIAYIVYKIIVKKIDHWGD